MRVLGIDPGLTNTGYGVVRKRDSVIEYITHGAISPDRNGSMPDRLATIYEGVCDVIATHNPEEIAVESLFFAKNAKTAFLLGQARGVAVMAAVHADLPLSEYAPAKIKTAVVGRGRAAKDQVAHMVRVIVSGAPREMSLDASDALAVAICHLHHRRRHPALS